MTQTPQTPAMEQGRHLHSRTTYAVWEITLKCNLACSHCGSRAGDSRSDELTTEQALDLVRQLAENGIREVSLIGGEAFLRKDWLQIAAAIKEHGMRAAMTTGGFGISRNTAERMVEAGFSAVSVSIDGLEEAHDRLRGRVGSWKQCFQAVEYMIDAGLDVGVNTQLNRISLRVLPVLLEKFRHLGVRAWQLQHTVPMGNAADQTDLLFQPYELLSSFPVLAYLAEKCAQWGIHLQPGNNVGYYSPYERRLRAAFTQNANDFYKGCTAGADVLGIEANGDIKGCPSLPTAAYVGGNIQKMGLQDILKTPELSFNDHAGSPQATEHLWGACQTCDFAGLCRGGCNWTSHVFFGKRGNNPYCIHRALRMAATGKRERLVQESAASGLPFDHGIFKIFEEAFDAPLPSDDPLSFNLDVVEWPQSWLDHDPDLIERLKQEQQSYLDFYRSRYGDV